LLQQLTKRVVEAALDGEIIDHVGYDKGDPAGKNGRNSRNGSRGKTVLTEASCVCAGHAMIDISLTRKCAASLQRVDRPRIVPGQPRYG
jgi:hypothetical protein